MRKKSGVTLLELIISLCIFSMIFLGFASIQLFSKYSFLAAKRRAVVQNAVILVLEHLTKSVTGTNFSGGAIGDKANFPVKYQSNIAGSSVIHGIRIKLDSNKDGKLDDGDGEIAYGYDLTTYQMLFYGGATRADTKEPITTGHIKADFSSESSLTSVLSETYINYDETKNYLDVQITGRWDPSKEKSKDNPQVVMRSRIKMPSVSSY